MSFSRVSIPSWSIKDWLLHADSQPPPFPPRAPVEVVGPLEIRGNLPGRLPSLAGILFLDDVDFEGAGIDGPLDFSRCLFVKRLLLRNLDLSGELRLDDAEILDRAKVFGGAQSGVDLAGARLRGGLRALRLNAAGVEFDASGAHIDHHAALDGAHLSLLRGRGTRIAGHLRLGAYVRGNDVLRTEIDELDLEAADIRGDLILSALLVRGRKRDPISLGLRNAKIGGDIFGTAVRIREAKDNLRPTEIRGADLSNIEVKGRLLLEGAQTNSLILSGADLRGGVAFERASLDGFLLAAEMGLVDLSYAKIGAGVSLWGTKITTLSLRSAQIAGDFTAGTADVAHRAEIGTADLSNVDLNGRLSLTGARMKLLQLTGSNLRGGMECRSAVVSDASGPSLYATELDSLELSTAKSGADVLLAGIAIGEVKLTGTRIDGDLFIYCDRVDVQEDAKERVIRQALASRNALLKSAKVANEMAGSPLSREGYLRPTVGTLDARNIRMQGQVGFQGLNVEGDLTLLDSELRVLGIGPEDVFPSEVEGTIQLSLIRNAPWVTFEALKCRGEVRMIGAELGTTQMRLGPVGESVSPCSVGLLVMDHSHVNGNLELTHLQVDGTVTNATRQGVWIDTCRIEGDLSFWHKDWLVSFRERYPKFKLGSALRPWDHGAAVIGPVTIKNCTIGGDCELTFLKTLGEVTVEHCAVGGGLLVRSLVTLADHLNGGAEMRALKAQTDPVFRAIAPRLCLRMTSVAQNVDLTGATLFIDPANHWLEDGRCGHVVAEYLEVKGDLVAYDANKNLAHIVVPCALDLFSAHATRLIVSGDSFPKADSKRGPQGLLLTGGRFREVTFPYIPRDKDGCPDPTDLEDVSVELWHVGNTKPDEEPSAEAYANLLESDPVFRRSTYRSIENNLRNRGYEDTATEIYRAMHLRERRDARLRTHPILCREADWTRTKARAAGQRMVALLRQLPGPVQRAAGKAGRGFAFVQHWVRVVFGWLFRSTVWHLIWRHALRFGTDPTRLALVITFLALISFPIYWNPSNIEPAAGILARNPAWEDSAEPGAIRGRSPAHWGPWDGLALLVRHHIPILPVSMREGWQLRDDAGLDYDLSAFINRTPCRSRSPNRASEVIGQPPYCDDGGAWHRHLDWVTAGDWAGLMSIVNMMMWPLLLAFLLRKLLRE